MLDYTNNDTWIAAILGSLLGLMFCFLVKKILDKKGKKSLTQLLKELKFIGIIIRIFLTLMAIMMLIVLLFTLQTFAKSFFLTKSNTFFVLIPIVILITYLGFKGYNLLSYILEFFLPIAGVFTILSLASLLFKADLTNLKPFFSHNNLDMIKSIIVYFSFSASPLIFLLDLEFENNSIVNSYIISSVISIVAIIVISTVLGHILSKVYRFPEYMVLKEIKMFNFVEKVENFFSTSWLLDNFVTLSFLLCFLKRILPKKNNNYLYLLIIVIVFYITIYVFGNSYINDLYLYYYAPYIFGAISLICIIPLFIYSIKKTK